MIKMDDSQIIDHFWTRRNQYIVIKSRGLCSQKRENSILILDWAAKERIRNEFNTNLSQPQRYQEIISRMFSIRVWKPANFVY